LATDFGGAPHMIYGIALILLALQLPLNGGRPPAAGAACDPAWLALFTPARPRLGHYEACIADGTVPGEGFHLAEPERLEPLDAFGTAGSYDRDRLAQLFGGTRITVTRGWREEGRRFESITLLSPYPDPTLTRIIAGTLIIRWITERETR
jgi:hypothetical protein